jgi:hypothetical protein
MATLRNRKGSGRCAFNDEGDRQQAHLNYPAGLATLGRSGAVSGRRSDEFVVRPVTISRPIDRALRAPEKWLNY